MGSDRRLVVACLTALLAVARCVQFDLYLDSDDVQSLMGLAARLYYVRGGRPNVNAVGRALEVPSSVHTVNVTWTARTVPAFYKLTVDSDRDSVVAPTLNVPAEGAVPDGVLGTAFAVSLPCSVVSSRPVDVLLSVRVSSGGDRPNDDDGGGGGSGSNSNDDDSKQQYRRRRRTAADVVVGLVLRKFCADPPPADTDATSEDRSNPYYEQAFYRHMISAASAFMAVAVICCLTTSCYHREKARDLMVIKGFRHNDVYLKSAALDSSNNRFNPKSSSSSSSVPPPKTKATVKDFHECVSELAVQRQRIRLHDVQLEGTFGRVYRGLYTDANGKDEQVFVKTVTDQASAVQISVLLHEGLSMYGLNHKNILTVRAVSVEQHAEPFLLYPYNNSKNLKKFLQNCKTTESISYTLTTREIIDMTLQIVNGMQYLHKNRHLHRDVAARNCLVDPQLKIQIADNALSRDLFPSDYHCLGDNKNRPIKWMAVESLECKKFSTASDVWSFGVLLWELLTLCQQPYADIDPFEMSAYLQDGFRLTQPINCPDELFTVMACCWALAPNERPTFSQLSVFLNEFNNQLVKFV